MRTAKVFVSKIWAGRLIEIEKDKKYTFTYRDDYQGMPVSLTTPLSQKTWEYNGFPPFFDGLLPEGTQLQALLKQTKLDEQDYFAQLLAVGHDLVGHVTVEAGS